MWFWWVKLYFLLLFVRCNLCLCGWKLALAAPSHVETSTSKNQDGGGKRAEMEVCLPSVLTQTLLYLQVLTSKQFAVLTQLWGTSRTANIVAVGKTKAGVTADEKKQLRWKKMTKLKSAVEGKTIKYWVTALVIITVKLFQMHCESSFCAGLCITVRTAPCLFKVMRSRT